MNVAIFETEHFEAAYPLIRLFDTGENTITVFCYPAARQQLEYMLHGSASRFEWIEPFAGQNKISFIDTIYSEVKKRNIQLLYLNTVSDNFLFYARLVSRLPKVRVIMTVHMINNLFATKGKPALRKWIRAIGKKKLVRKVKEYNVLSAAMKPLLAARLGSEKKIHTIPGAVFEPSIYKDATYTPDTPVRIGVPGSIDGRRRNYDEVFKLLSLLQQHRIPAIITLAGRFYEEYGQRILERCKQWNNSIQSLKWFETGIIEQAEFDRILQEAHFIFTPSVINTVISDEVEETYGASISSGNVSDAIRYARPFIIPEALTVDAWLEEGCVRYKNVSDIAESLALVYNNPLQYEQYARASLHASENYTVEKIRERNEDIFGES